MTSGGDYLWGATIEYGVDLCIKSCEKSFPFKLISKAVTIKVEDGKASEEPD